MCGIKLVIALLWGSVYLPGAQNLITLNLAYIKPGFTVNDILGPSLSQSEVMIHSVTCNRSQEMEASAPKGGLFHLSSASPSTPPLFWHLQIMERREELCSPLN